MKSKRIVALALTAAMAVSMASMTAFAANPAWGAYQYGDEEIDTLTDLTADHLDNTKVGMKTGDREFTEGYFAEYEVYKTTENASNGKKYYLYRGGSEFDTQRISDGDGGSKTYTQHVLNKDDVTQLGNEEAGILWKNFKSKAEGLGTPTLELEDDYVFMGWTLDSTKAGYVKPFDGTATTATGNIQAADYKGEDVLKDMDEIIDKGLNLTPANGDGSKTSGNSIKIYPVFRAKTAAEKLESQVEIAKRVKVAKPTGTKEWVYTQKDLDRNTAYVSQPLAEAVSADALKKCNAEMGHSRVFEVKPQVGKDIVDLRKGATQEVKIPVNSLYPGKGEDGVNKLIREGKLKVYHIGSDGKSRQVTGIKSTGDGKAVTFKSGFYSEFVLTKDPNARAQAGEEDGASGGNPATGEASTLPVAMLALAALSATGVVAYKKRKAE